MQKGKISSNLNIEEGFFPTSVSAVGHENQVSKNLKKLERKVFVFNSSESDKKYFLRKFRLWLNNEGEHKEKSFTQLLWNLTYEVNNNGKTIKYLYFNEYAQKLYLDRDFYEWSKLMLDEIEKFTNSSC